MSPSNSYLRFIALRDALADHEPTQPSIDAYASKLLEVLAVKHWQDKTMTVTEAMALTHIASPATVHRKLQDLVDAKLVEFVFANGNNRTKYLHPTKKALELFDEFGKLMLLASSQTK